MVFVLLAGVLDDLSINVQVDTISIHWKSDWLLVLCWGCTLIYPYILSLKALEDIDTWGSPLPTFQAYHPVSHVYKFGFGMALARLYIDFFAVQDPDDERRLCISETRVRAVPEAVIFAFAGYALILWLFLPGQLDSFKLSLFFTPIDCQETILLPAFGLLIYGCALKRDPITKLLCKRPFRWLNDYNFTYEIYILQGCVWTMLQVVYQQPPVNPSGDEDIYKKWQKWTYLPILCVVAFFVNRYISQPIGKMMSER